MLIIYTESTCSFCHVVTDFMNDKGIEFEERDTDENESYVEELLQAGGKRQVPFLIDDERSIQMYESNDIIDYITEHYGATPEDIVM